MLECCLVSLHVLYDILNTWYLKSVSVINFWISFLHFVYLTHFFLLHSYYGDSADPAVKTRYLSQIRERASDVASKYPGWTMRVYYDGAEDDFVAVGEMCDIWCASDHVDFCDVNALPRPFGSLKSLMPVGEWLGGQKSWLF